MKLPVGTIARRSYGAVLGDPGALARCAAMPAVVWLAGNALLCALEGTLAGGPQRTPFADLVLESGPGIAFSVAWLRWVLLGERRPVLAAPRFGRRELAALALAIVLPLAAVAPFAVPLGVGAALGAGAADAGAAPKIAVTLLAVAAVLWIVLLALRTMIVFPLVALDAGLAAPARSWRATRGHGLALLLLFALTAGPPTAVNALASLALDDAPGALAWLALALDTTLYFPLAAIGMTATALAARHLGAAPDST